MQRRDVLKLLSSVAALSALPQEAFALLAQANHAATQLNGVRTLSPHQDATVTTIAELIIPETETPGAKGAKVNEFIDLLLTEWYEPTETKEFLAGLSDVDARSRKQFSKDFVSCSADQQMQLLKVLDAEAMEFTVKQRAAVTSSKKPLLQQTIPPPGHFFYTMKKLTLTGYYTSEIGFSKELGRHIIPPEHTGCAPVQISGVAR